MDSKRFDELIKGKIGNYSDPDYDSGAFAGLETRLDAPGSSFWAAQAYWEWFLGGLLLCLACYQIVSWKLVPIAPKGQPVDQSSLIMRLQSENELLREKLLAYEVEMAGGREDSASGKEISSIDSPMQSVGYHQSLTTSGDSSLIMLINQLERSGVVIRDEEGEAAIDWSHPAFVIHSKTLHIHHVENDHHAIKIVAFDADHHAPAKMDGPESGRLSASQAMELEKHYHKGVGIQLGPVLDMGSSIYDRGEGDFDWGMGVMADFRWHPYLSTETGLMLKRRAYRLDDDDTLSPNTLPDLNESAGAVTGGQSKAILLEVPVLMKYTRLLSDKSALTARLGYSAQAYLSQNFEYQYEFDQEGSDDDDHLGLNSSAEVEGIRIYPGSIHVGLGYNRRLSRSQSMDLSLFYQYGLGTYGVEQRSVNSFGLRSVYWFQVR